MAEPNPELRAAIDVAKQRVKVDTYYTIAMNKGLKGHAQGYWAGTAMGMMTGGLGGSLLSLALFLMPVASLPAAVVGLIGWPLILGIAGLGAVVGGTVIGGDLGRAAGTSAGVMAEKERREKADALEKEILASPEKQREAIAAYRMDPVVEKDTTAGEIFATTRNKGKALNKLIDLPTMALTVALCSAVRLHSRAELARWLWDWVRLASIVMRWRPLLARRSVPRVVSRSVLLTPAFLQALPKVPRIYSRRRPCAANRSSRRSKPQHRWSRRPRVTILPIPSHWCFLRL